MASSASSVANSEQPFYMCRECRTQICLADKRVFEDGNKEYVPREEMNVKVVAGANEWIRDMSTYVDVSCPECLEDVGYKVKAKQEGDTIVAKDGEVELYMGSVLLRDGNSIYKGTFVPTENPDLLAWKLTSML